MPDGKVGTPYRRKDDFALERTRAAGTTSRACARASFALAPRVPFQPPAGPRDAPCIAHHLGRRLIGELSHEAPRLALDRRTRRAERRRRIVVLTTTHIHARVEACALEHRVGGLLPQEPDGGDLPAPLAGIVELAKLLRETPFGVERPGRQHQVRVVVALVASRVGHVHDPGAHRAVAVGERVGKLAGERRAPAGVELEGQGDLHVAQNLGVLAPLRGLDVRGKRLEVRARRARCRGDDAFGHNLVSAVALAVVVAQPRARAGQRDAVTIGERRGRAVALGPCVGANGDVADGQEGNPVVLFSPGGVVVTGGVLGGAAP